MDRSRRNRRNRGHSHSNTNSNRTMSYSFTPPPPPKWSFLSGLYSLFIMSSLIVLIYLMLDYHCTNCKDKCDMNNITKSIDDIAKNLSVIKDSYYDLEMKISRFSQDLPKLEGQIDILEALANTMEKSHLGWDPKSQLSLPNVDVYLNRQVNVQKKNCSNEMCSMSAPPPAPKAVEVNTD